MLLRSATAALLAVLFGITAATPAVAQEVARAISPLRIEPDINGVNLVTGKLQLPTPSISVPAAPRLKFDRIQFAAPYVQGTRASDPGQPWSVAVQTNEATSEGFTCIDVDCESNGVGTGSTFRPARRIYRQSGSGTVYTYNAKSYDTIVGTNSQFLYYLSTITYPDGEVISYTYDSVQPSGDFRIYCGLTGSQAAPAITSRSRMTRPSTRTRFRTASCSRQHCTAPPVPPRRWPA